MTNSNLTQLRNQFNEAISPIAEPMRKYLWDNIQFPIWYPTGERILTWLIAPQCYWRLFSMILLGNTHTVISFIFWTFKFDLFKDANLLILSSGLTFNIVPWFITLFFLMLGMYLTVKYQRNEEGRIDPTWGPMSYIFRFAFILFSLFTSYHPLVP